MISPIAHIVVGVADMKPVKALWCERFGLEVVAARHTPDADLARLWGLPDDAVVEQLLLRTPGARAGWLHFVRFARPGLPVRMGAAATDLCPKNLDVNCVDMPARCAELESDGYEFRSAASEYSIGDTVVREVQMPSHDATNVVLIEVVGVSMKLSSKNYGAVSSFVLTVPDTVTEAAFFGGLFGHQELMHHRISGAEIESVIGLPAGTALDMRLLGSPDEYYGRVELIAYEGLAGASLYARARPPALGTLLCRFEVADPDALLQQARERGFAAEDKGEVDTLFGRCRIISLLSPAGFTVEALKISQD